MTMTLIISLMTMRITDRPMEVTRIINKDRVDIYMPKNMVHYTSVNKINT